MSPTSVTTDQEVQYRSALGVVRALVANDDLAAETIARHADGALLRDLASVCLYLLCANVNDPLAAIDRLFDQVPETLVRAAEHRRRDSSGTGDEVAL